MEGILNNRLLLENNMLLFSLLFLEIFVGEQGLDGGDKVVNHQHLNYISKKC